MGDMFANEVPQNHENDPNRVEVAPFGPKLCQNVAPRLRIIFQALLGPKTLFKNQKKTKIIKFLPDVRNIVRHVRHVRHMRHVRNMFPRPGTTFGANTIFGGHFSYNFIK